ncbi:hypothetical protein Calab_3352 [Caldithrix abyssi DSM 13497]|uniref:Uncharacterized protein n=1 Tax=Caldithrix abyssi DSM 13497 TaxID=880073 RepID=H1XW51_CALAY|nr:hypothetical protein [Caldithrix abyssi]APF19005.1 hypothetical protein Cabys_2256 [Caldithrix abyssi DSM 13497]EHO42956.1 hypothetical protein Calab_3352 [Caldithrix abyssi DSM 13497]
MADQELLTAGKIAKEFGLPQKKIKEIIKKLNLEPDVKKGNCSYYYRETAEKIKAEAEKE